MAARRVAKSAVDWAAFAERVPKNQVDAFRQFKSKSDLFVTRVHQHSENLKPIDFAFYKSRIAAPGLVDSFEKAYASVSVPYPKDTSNLKAQIDAEEKEAAAKTEQFVAEMKKSISDATALFAKIDSVPPLSEFTLEMYGEYFPDSKRDPVNKPSFWPHTKMDQPGNDPNEIK